MRWINLSVALAFLCGGTLDSDAGDDCGESSLANDELEVVRAIYEFCKDVKGVAVGSDVICLVSKLNYESWAEYKKALGLYRGTNQKYFYINSTGGNVPPATNIANDLFVTSKTLIVSQYCLSACANYLFTAVPRRILLGGASVGWHGSPTDGNYDERIPGNRRAIDAHNKFLSNFSTDYGDRIQRLMNQPPDSYQYRGAGMRNHFWEHSDDSLCKEFGIRNIIRIPVPQ